MGLLKLLGVRRKSKNPNTGGNHSELPVQIHIHPIDNYCNSVAAKMTEIQLRTPNGHLGRPLNTQETSELRNYAHSIRYLLEGHRVPTGYFHN